MERYATVHHTRRFEWAKNAASFTGETRCVKMCRCLRKQTSDTDTNIKMTGGGNEARPWTVEFKEQNTGRCQCVDLPVSPVDALDLGK